VRRLIRLFAAVLVLPASALALAAPASAAPPARPYPIDINACDPPENGLVICYTDQGAGQVVETSGGLTVFRVSASSTLDVYDEKGQILGHLDQERRTFELLSESGALVNRYRYEGFGITADGKTCTFESFYIFTSNQLRHGVDPECTL
jgi:hypothetical protein